MVHVYTPISLTSASNTCKYMSWRMCLNSFNKLREIPKEIISLQTIVTFRITLRVFLHRSRTMPILLLICFHSASLINVNFFSTYWVSIHRTPQHLFLRLLLSTVLIIFDLNRLRFWNSQSITSISIEDRTRYFGGTRRRNTN